MKMKTKKGILSLCLAVGVGAFAVACGTSQDVLPEIAGEKETVVTEFGDTIDLTQYFKSGDSVVSAMLYTPSGKRISMQNGTVTFQEMGEYTLYLTNGNGVVFSVNDTKGPLITRATIQDYYHIGTEFDLGIRSIDARDGVCAVDGYTVSFSETQDGEPTDVTATVVNYKFTPTQTGYYTVQCTSKDSLGNVSDYSYTFYAEQYYELLYDNNITLTGDFVSLGYGFKQVNESKKRLVKHTVSQSSWATIDFSGDSLNGATFEPFTTYEFAVDYTIAYNNGKEDNSATQAFTMYLSNACYTVFHKAVGESGTLQFQVTSNKNGALYWHYNNAVRFNEAMEITWDNLRYESKQTHVKDDNNEGHTFQGKTDGQYHTLKIVEGPYGCDFFNEEVHKDGRDVYVTRRVGNTGEGCVTMKLSGAGFQPNTYYTFVLSYDWAFSNNGNFAFYILNAKNMAVSEARGYKTNSQIEYIVQTNAHGEYELIYTRTYVSNMATIEWQSIHDKAEEKGSVYGDGLSVSCSIGNSKNENKMYLDGENAGYTRAYQRLTGSGSSSLKVTANKDADLKPNTEYLMRIQANTDGRYYPIGQSNWQWEPLTKDNGEIVYSLKTDDAGCFSVTMQTYYDNSPTFVEFVAVSFEEVTSSVMAKTAGTTVTLSLSGLGLSFGSNVAANSDEYAVEKVKGEGTEIKTLDMVRNASFQVEKGYFYNVYVTVSTVDEQPITRFVQIYEGDLILQHFETAAQTLIHPSLPYKKTIVNGNVSYQFFTRTVDNAALNAKTSGVNMLFNGPNDEIHYDVYGDVSYAKALASGEYGLQPNASTWITKDGRYYLGRSTSNANGWHQINWLSMKGILDGVNNYALIDNLVLVPIYVTNATNETAAAGETVNITEKFAVTTYGVDENSITYTVAKTVGASTQAATSVTLTNGSFVVESGCFYEITMTATANDGREIVKYMQLTAKDLTAFVHFNGGQSMMALNVPPYAFARVEENGNAYYKMYATAAAQNKDFGIDVKALDGVSSSTVYDVYFDVRHANPLESGAYSAKLKNGATIDGDGRYYYSFTGSYVETARDWVLIRFAEFNHELMDGESNYLTIDNVVFVPRPIQKTSSNDISATAESTFTLSPQSLGLAVAEEAQVTYSVTEKMGAGSESVALGNVGSFTVGAGKFYEVTVTATVGESTDTAYVVVKDESLDFIGYQNNITVFTQSERLGAEKINVGGNGQYKLWWTKKSTDNALLYLNGKNETKTPTSFDIYADVSYVGTLNDAENYVLKVDGGASIVSMGRVKIGTAKYWENGYYLKVWVNSGLDNSNGYLVIDNVVRVKNV